MGSSAGAFIGAGLASGLRVRDLEEITLRIQLDDFWDPGLGLGFVRGRKLEKLLAQYFKSDFSELHTPLRVSTFDIVARKTRVFTDGPLARVCVASAAVPLLFHPVRIANRYFWDGGVLDKSGIHGIPATERLLIHYLQGESLYESFERKKLQKKMPAHHKIIQLQKVPRCGPKKLHLGPEILTYTYKQTLQSLDSPLSL